MFKSLDYFEKNGFINTVNGLELKLACGGMTLPISGTGHAVIQGKDNARIRFENALFVPKLSKNLIAGCILLQDQINICPNGPMGKLKNQDIVMLRGMFNKNLMEFKATPNPRN